MSSKEVTFFFAKAPESYELRFLEAKEGRASIAADGEKACSAMKAIFSKLIALNNGPILLGLSSFSATLLRPLPNSNNPRLRMDEQNVTFTGIELTPPLVALFYQSFTPHPNDVCISSENEAQLNAERLHQEILLEGNSIDRDPPSPPVGGSLIPPADHKGGVAGFTLLPSAPIAAKSSSEVLPKQLSEQEVRYQTIVSLMEGQFPNTKITRLSSREEEFFGTYLMQRVLGKPESCHFDFKTHEFTLNFKEEKRIRLTQLPEGKSPKSLAELKQLHHSALRIPKELKGKFNLSEGKLTFEPGSLKLEWSWSSAQLLGIFENPHISNAVTMHVKYLKITAEGPVLAQDFVDMLECNLK